MAEDTQKLFDLVLEKAASIDWRTGDDHADAFYVNQDDFRIVVDAKGVYILAGEEPYELIAQYTNRNEATKVYGLISGLIGDGLEKYDRALVWLGGIEVT